LSGVFERLGRFAARHRIAVIAAYLAVSLLLLWRGTSIRLETSLAELLPRGTPSADDLRALLEAGGSVDRLLISIWREPGDPDPAEEPLVLAELAEELAGSLRASGLIKSVRYGIDEKELESAARFAMAHLPVLVPGARAADLAARLEQPGIRASLERLRERLSTPGLGVSVKRIAAADPLGLAELAGQGLGPTLAGIRLDPESGLFLSEDGRRLLMVIEAARPPTEIAFSRRLLAAVEEAETKLRASGGEAAAMKFDHAGGHLFALEDERRIRRDATATTLFSLVAIAAIYLFVIRRPVLWLAILVPLSMTTVWTLGLAAIYPGRLNMITVAFAAILLGIGDDAMIHMYLREREERAKGVPAPESAVAAMRATGMAVTVATLTSAAAFLSLSFVRFRGLAELGVIGAMGMLTLLAGVLVFFPAALALLARKEEDPRGTASLRLPLHAFMAAQRFTLPRRRPILAGVGLATAVMIAAASGIEVSADLRSIRGEDPAAEALARVLAPYGSGAAAETMVVMHDGDREGSAVQREEALASSEALAHFCGEAAASGLISGCEREELLPPSEALQRERFERLGPLPWNEAAVALEREALNLGMEPGYFSEFIRDLSRYGRFDEVRIAPGPDTSLSQGAPRTRVVFADPGDAREIAAAIRARFRGRPIRIASVALVSEDLGGILQRDYRRAALLVLGAIALLSLAAFRRAKLFLATMAPVLLGGIWLLGTARLAGIELNLMSLMGIPIVFGLGVDYGVYVVDRWASEGGRLEAAMAGVGPALLVTGLTTLAGFAALLTAQLAGLRSLGFVVVVGTGFTLAAALFVLPLLLESGGGRNAVR